MNINKNYYNFKLLNKFKKIILMILSNKGSPPNFLKEN